MTISTVLGLEINTEQSGWWEFSESFRRFSDNFEVKMYSTKLSWNHGLGPHFLGGVWAMTQKTFWTMAQDPQKYKLWVMSQNTQKYVWAMAQTPQKYNIWAYRVPWSCQTGLGQIGFGEFTKEPKCLSHG